MRRRIKSARLRILLITGLALTVLIVVALLSQRSTSDTVVDVASEAEPVFVNLEKEIPQKFPDYQVRRTGWTGQRATGSPISVPGYDFAISSESLPGLLIHPKLVNDELITPSQPAQNVSAFVQQQFKDAGFTEGPSGNFRGDNEVCTLEQELDSQQLELRCKGKKLEAALAKQARPFVDMYLEAHKDVRAPQIIYGPMVIRSQNSNGSITASKTAGYDLAEAVMQHREDSSIALYYSKQGKWHYTTEATNEFGFSCSDITKDRDARKAYRGQWCYQRENDAGLRILDPEGAEDCGRIACDENMQQQR